MTVDCTVVPTAEEALVVTEAAPARRELARLGLEVRALTLLFVSTDGKDTPDTRIHGTLARTPTTSILVTVPATLAITLVRILTLTRTRTIIVRHFTLHRLSRA